MGRTVVIAIGVLLAAVFSQAPEFVQQYRQRLGGAIDELAKIVTAFEIDAKQYGLDRKAALEKLTGNSDPLAAQRGKRMTRTIGRYERLERQQKALETSGPVFRMVAFVRDFDTEVADGAYDDFEPAVPVTTEGILAAVVGFFLGLFGGGSALFANNWRKERKAKREEEARIAAEVAARLEEAKNGVGDTQRPPLV